MPSEAKEYDGAEGMNTFKAKCRTCLLDISMDQDPVTKKWRPVDVKGGQMLAHRCIDTFTTICKFCGESIRLHKEGEKWLSFQPEGEFLPHRCREKAESKAKEERELARAKKARRAAWLADHPEETARAAARHRVKEEVSEYDAAVVRQVEADDGFEDDIP